MGLGMYHHLFSTLVGFLSDYSATQTSIRYHKRELIYIEAYGGGGGGSEIYRAETTHQNRPKRPTLKSGRNDPGRNDPAETTHGRNDSCPKRPTAKTTRNRFMQLSAVLNIFIVRT